MSKRMSAKQAAVAVAFAVRERGAGSVEHLDARRTLAAVKIQAYVERELREAPPLTDDQKARLAGLFGGAK